MIRRTIDAGSTRQVDFLKSLVRVASDNPPGDCAPHAEIAAAGFGRAGLRGRASSGAGRPWCAKTA